MGKAKRQNKDMKNAKQQLHTIKNGSVKKDKNPKFKNTPVGKVALINNSKAQNKNVALQKNVQKDAGIKNNQNLSKNNAKQSKQNSAKNKQNSPNGAQNKPANKKTNLTPTKELEEIDDSDSDIDEKIILQEDVSLDETFEDEEESDTGIPDIFGQSLQDESDEDDEDFEEEEEEDDDDCDNDIKGELVEFKSVKVLKGVKPKAKDNEDNKNKNDENKKLRQVTVEDDEDDEDDDEDDEDDEDEEDEDENENLDLHKDILEENLEDESNEDDEDFEEEEEEEDNDDDDDDSNEDDKIKGETLIHKGVKMFKGAKSQIENSEDEDEDDDDEDEDEDDDDDDENEDEDSTLGLKALLGNSIADEDDDEDFNEEDEDDEDDDISDEDEDGEENDNTKITKEKTAKISNSKDILKGQKQVKEGEKKLSSKEQEEIDKRTIFIDNIPKETKETEIRKVFSKFGPINNLRFRGIVPQDTKMSKKVAAIKKQIHPKVTTVVVFINYKSEESAQKALSMNGKIFEGNYIHVKIVDKSEKKEWDSKKAVFIGNLKFGIENNIIWKEFSKCGEIDSVHLVRDKQTGQTKGFGYVNFKTEESAALALKLDGVEIMKRPIRVKAHVSGHNRKGEKRMSSNDNEGNPRKKFKNNLEKPVACKGENEANIKKHQKSQKNNAKSAEQKLNSFLGQKADSKNRKKENKIDKKKKQMAKKLTAQSNKSVKV